MEFGLKPDSARELNQVWCSRRFALRVVHVIAEAGTEEEVPLVADAMLLRMEVRTPPAPTHRVLERGLAER